MTQTSAQPVVRNLAVPGATLQYEVRGDGPVLAVIGSPMTASEFAAVADALAVDHTVVTYDPRGLGASPIDDPAQDSTPELRADWMAELEAVRAGMLTLRRDLANELRTLSGSDRFDFVAHHRGMFSRLGATPAQVQKVKDEFAIYMVGDSRINIAGLNQNTIPVLARAIIEAGV